jgi:glyoxylase-like metal-dependent hydrolase (beta-lactamase superfamily II)
LIPDSTRWLTDDTGLIDLHFQDTPRIIASYLLPTSDGLALIECGTTPTIERLLEGIKELGHDPADLRHILVTHIHLDHAGAAGQIMERFPDVRLYVHEIGAPHMIDPANLIRSAERIYTDRMEELWGEIKPVPADRVQPLTDGDVLNVGGRELRVVYTPGHASHHVAYHDPVNDQVFTGDVAGVRIPPAIEVWPPTPPPDINIEGWHESIDRLREIAPGKMLLTHYGPHTDVSAHLDQLESRIDEWVSLIETLANEGLDRDQIVERLAEHVRAEMSEHGTADMETSFALTTPHGMSVDGLLRYLRKRGRIA